MEVMPVIVMAEEKHHLISHCCPDCIMVALHKGKGSIFPRHAFLERPALLCSSEPAELHGLLVLRLPIQSEIQSQMDSCEAKG